MKFHNHIIFWFGLILLGLAIGMLLRFFFTGLFPAGLWLVIALTGFVCTKYGSWRLQKAKLRQLEERLKEKENGFQKLIHEVTDLLEEEEKEFSHERKPNE